MMELSAAGKKARELYEGGIRQKVEADNFGRYIVIDVNSGDYEVGDDHMTLTDRLFARHENPSLYLLRIGHRAAGKFGWRGRFMVPSGS